MTRGAPSAVTPVGRDGVGGGSVNQPDPNASGNPFARSRGPVASNEKLGGGGYHHGGFVGGVSNAGYPGGSPIPTVTTPHSYHREVM